jgi:hypothetical protein
MKKAVPQEQIQPEERETIQQESALTPEQIALRAYCLWTDAGCPPDSAEEDWLEAERQLKEETRFDTAGM